MLADTTFASSVFFCIYIFLTELYLLVEAPHELGMYVCSSRIV